MKARELYSGAAPAAMGQMGQGLNEVGAGIARSIQSGYSQLGQGLGQGLASLGQSVGKAYDEYKQAKASNDITKIALEDPDYRKMLGIYSEEDAAGLRKNLDMAIKRNGQIGGAQFSKQLLSPLAQYQAQSTEYEERMKIARLQAANQLGIAGIQADVATRSPYNHAIASGMMGVVGAESGLPQKGAGFGGGVPIGIDQPLRKPRSYIYGQ